MNLFNFKPKNHPTHKEYSLEEIPLFSHLKEKHFSLIRRASKVVEFKSGDSVYSQSHQATAFYVILSGRFRLIYKGNESGNETQIIEFFRGDHFGETALLTDNVRTATAVAKTDGILLTIEKNDFFKLLEQIPALSLQLNQSLGRQLIRTEMGYSDHRHQVRIASVQSLLAFQEISGIVSDFLSALQTVEKKRIIVLDLSSKDRFVAHPKSIFNLSDHERVEIEKVLKCVDQERSDYHTLSVYSEGEDGESEKHFIDLVSKLTYEYDYMLFCISEKGSVFQRKALNYSDRVYLFSQNDERSTRRLSRKIIRLKERHGFTNQEFKWVVPFKDREAEGRKHTVGEKVEDVSIFTSLSDKANDSDAYSRKINFMAKEWARKLLGLALGSGAAYGLAHIGVLRALEEAKIEVDIVSGSSIGALIGGVWTAGYDADFIENVVKGIGSKRKAFHSLIGFRDLCLPHKGPLKGNQVRRFLSQYLGGKYFHDLKIPLRVIGADLFTSEEIVFESGNVIDAIRASISIPGVFRAVPYKGSLLIDGGVLDPLPIRPLTDMGVDKIIAVNVLPSTVDRINRQNSLAEAHKEELSRAGLFKTIWIKFCKRVERYFSSNVFNVLMNTIQFLEYEMAKNSSEDADVFVHAVVPDANWIEFYNCEKFIKRGEEVIAEQMPNVQSLVVE